MNWLEAMNRAVDYMEAHLTEKISMEEVSRAALSSPYHFQRMYHVVTGITLAEYIRRRKLTMAAQDIIAGEKILDTALKYAYESPEAFTKAFKKLHGIPPSAVKKPGIRLKAYPKLSFHISIKGDQDMEYKIMERDSFAVFGRQGTITMIDGENFKQVPEFWQKCQQEGFCDWICKQAQERPVMGICKDFNHEKEEFHYMIATEGTCQELPENCVMATIPAATWAVFDSVGPIPEAVQTLTRRIFSEWLPATGYQHDCAPELEVYFAGDPRSADYHCQIWIPIKK